MVLITKPDDPLWRFKSQFGAQPLSKRRSAPQWGFGTSPVPVLLPTKLSALPGPGAYTPVLAPPQRNSPNKASADWSSSLTFRDSQSAPAHLAVPGPTRYTTATAHCLGRTLPVASLHSSPRFSWSRTSTRAARCNTYVSREHERECYGLHSPGPHTVGREAFNSMGHQKSSTRPTLPRFAQMKERRFFTLKAADTSATPGPGSYDI